MLFSFVAPAAAGADSTVTVKYGPTQKQSDASLTSTQVGTYAKGAKVTLRCYLNGQNVQNAAKQWSKIWYRVADGWFVAAVDLSASPSKVVAGIPVCAATAPGLSTVKTYTITSLLSNKVIDVTGGAANNGVKIQQYPASKNNRAQQFQFTSTGGRFYRVTSVLNTSKVWDVSKSNGTSVQLWGWGGQKATSSNQQWLLFAPSGKTADGVEFRLRADTNKCLDVPGGSTANVKLQVYKCNGTKSQRFKLTEIASPGIAADTVDKFVKKWEGRLVGDGQCVALFNVYNSDVVKAGFVSATHAYQLYANAPTSKYEKLPASATPRKGDVAIWKASKPYSGGSGHVAIVLRSISSSTIQTLTQNARTKDYPDGSPVVVLNDSTSHLLGYLRPKG